MHAKEESFSRESEGRSPESSANYEGNHSLLLIERVKHPGIKSQIIDLLFRFHPDESPKNAVAMVAGASVHPSREWMKKEFEKRLRAVEKGTPITFGDEQPGAGKAFGKSKIPREFISLNWRFPSGAPLGAKQKSIIEAHEKGHVLRPYQGVLFSAHFAAGFDKEAAIFTGEDHEIEKEASRKEREERGEEDLTYEDARQRFLQYLFSGSEIAERMSQLKNYFGFRGNEQFTKAHLDYARAHYVRDTGFDNRMSHFFQAITSRTEDAFLRLINSSGI